MRKGVTGVLTKEQRERVRVLMSEGLTRDRARWRVLAPEQREHMLKQISIRKQRARDKNPRHNLLVQLERNARRRGIEFALTETDLDWPVYCPVTGVKLIYGGDGAHGGRGSGRRPPRPEAASFDRRNNSRGYVRGNVIIVSNWVNTRKGNASSEQLRRIADFYTEQELLHG